MSDEIKKALMNIQKTLEEHSRKLSNLDNIQKNIQKTLEEHSRKLSNLDNIQEVLEKHDRMLRDLSYKVDDLDFAFRRHEKAHQFSEEDVEDLYEEPTPALGGIAGAISPTGRFMRW